MGDRRMLTRKVTDDDAFMSLSSSAQALYLHLSMSADDDGFNNQVTISMFKAHASIQDLEALLSKRYIYQFENGVIVIKHWRMANALRKDRYTPTAFQEELSKLKITENGSYTLNGQMYGNQMATDWQPNGNPSKDKLSKDKLSKDNISKDISVINNTLSLEKSSDTIVFEQNELEIFNYWNKFGITKHKSINPKMRKAIDKATKLYSMEQIKLAIEHYATCYLNKNYYFEYKWTLDQFLSQDNALPDFLDDGNKWLNFINSKEGKHEVEKDMMTSYGLPSWFYEK